MPGLCLISRRYGCVGDPASRSLKTRPLAQEMYAGERLKTKTVTESMQFVHQTEETATRGEAYALNVF